MIRRGWDWIRREGLYAGFAVLVTLTAFHFLDPLPYIWPADAKPIVTKAIVTTAAVAAPMVMPPPAPPPIPAKKPVPKRHRQAHAKPKPQPPAQTFLFWTMK